MHGERAELRQQRRGVCRKSHSSAKASTSKAHLQIRSATCTLPILQCQLRRPVRQAPCHCCELRPPSTCPCWSAVVGFRSSCMLSGLLSSSCASLSCILTLGNVSRSTKKNRTLTALKPVRRTQRGRGKEACLQGSSREQARKREERVPMGR